MNIHDVDDFPYNKDSALFLAIFEKQKVLFLKYLPIEHKSELGHGLIGLHAHEYPLNLHDKWHQYLIKDFCWRVTEEFAEALEALRAGHRDHFVEEMMDALHFFVELLHITGMFDKVEVDYRPIVESRILEEWDPWHFVMQLGLVANCLKNKPWKQTHQLTDVQKFELLLADAWGSFGMTLAHYGITRETIHQTYFKKAAVNEFRQDSNY